MAVKANRDRRSPARVPLVYAAALGSLLALALVGRASPSLATTYGAPDPQGLLAFQSNRGGGSWDIYEVRADGIGLSRVPASSPDSDDTHPSFAPPDNPVDFTAGISAPGPSEAGPHLSIDREQLDGVDQVLLDGVSVPFTLVNEHQISATVPTSLASARCVTLRRQSELAGATPDLISVDERPDPSLPPCPDTRGDGRPLVFSSIRSGSWDLWAYDPRRPVSANNPVDLTPTSGSGERFPTWSPEHPDGPTDSEAIPQARSLIAYVRTRKRNSDIYVLDPRKPLTPGTNPSRLTSGPAEDLNPEWAMNGKELAFDSNRSGVREIWTMRVSYDATQGRWVGSDLVDLTAGQLPARQPTWYSLDLNGPAYEQIVFAGPARRGGRSILNYVEEPGGDALLGDLPFSDPAPVTTYTVSNDPGPDQEPAWAPGADALAVSRRTHGHWHIAILAHGHDPTNAFERPPVHFATSGSGDDLNPAWQALPYDAEPYARHIYGRVAARRCRPRRLCRRH